MVNVGNGTSTIENDSRGNLDCFSFMIGRNDDGRRKITKKALKRELARRQIVLDKNAERDFCIYIRVVLRILEIY